MCFNNNLRNPLLPTVSNVRNVFFFGGGGGGEKGERCVSTYVCCDFYVVLNLLPYTANRTRFYILTPVLLSARVVWDVTLYPPAIPSIESDSATILRNVGNRLPNDRNSVTSGKN